MMLLGVLGSVVVAGGLAAGVWWGWAVLRDRPVLLVRARTAEQQAAALDARLEISRVEYDAERALWSAALEESGPRQS
jgi:hypothetical protein